MTYFLENAWLPDPAPAGTWQITLTNLSDEPLSDFKLSLTSITRIMPEHQITGATFHKRAANFHEFAPEDAAPLASGDSWSFSVEGLNRSPFHRNDAAKTAWITTSDGTHHDVVVGDLTHAGMTPVLPQPRLPEGRLTLPFALLPWPNEIDAEPGEAPVLLHAAGASTADLRLMISVDALHGRLFPQARRLFQLSTVPGSRALRFATDESLPAEGYRLDFGDAVTLTAAGEAGRRYGLIALAQMLHGAFSDPDYKFPATGHITDAPRYDWRGCHLDVSRHFWQIDDVARVVDILAWQKLNIFHWHLTDDEGWRAEIKALPQLTDAGATRGAELSEMLPQLGDGPEPKRQYYTQGEMRDIVAHAASLGIEVMPEIETPGHAICVLAAMPELKDPDEEPDSYYSVQGFFNNALNPAMPAVYEMLEKVFDEIVEIFPSRYIHIGGDEVAPNAWLGSPRARELMEQEDLDGTFELQSWFMHKIKAMLDARGKVMVGWNEIAHGGGVPPEDTIVMAWENPAVGIELARDGYGVVMTPGQAYYLDMVQSDDWLDNGAGWAGSVSPEQSYTFEAEGDFPEDLRDRMRGIQACIWCEHYTTKAWFNDLVFPRLGAMAEAAWTHKDHKDWQRFARQVRLHPSL
ncbi:beta-N-acetylhexosaminidase [Salipiger sp. IMCC34102]|uniref:beta-N-acetylhexosaminidase n=1 Tax=Salipiger sp. IMCC34102 TaxID=2510647 RepID=UPI00101D9EAA|nr:family 20 glycosylhydrolase [Salipiger sp. IMCC34102]RYH04488.1 beta-N-acetylhexosaminidase [Salipiger sp. IMCC34102]